MKRLAIIFTVLISLIFASQSRASNTSSYLVQNKRLGELVQLPYNGDSFTAIDGTVWKAANSTLLAYSSSYSALLTDAPSLVTAQTYLPSPYTSALWWGKFPRTIIGATAGGSTWLMIPNVLQSTGTPDSFYTSTNAGSSWTTRTVPLASKGWNGVWDGTNFVVYATSTTTNGAQVSSDGVSWSGHTAISLGNIMDFVYASSISTYLVCSSGGTTCATSTDGGSTWTARTAITTPTTFPNSTTHNYSQSGMGYITWNSTATLFLMGTSTSGNYQTSPDGVTWTSRSFTVEPAISGSPTSAAGFFTTTPLFASNSTTTLAFGLSGVVGTTTNGTSWTYAVIDTTLNSIQTDSSNRSVGLNSFSIYPIASYYNGTNFIVVYNNGSTYYSSNGSSWTASTRGNSINASSYPLIVAAALNSSSTGLMVKTPVGHATCFSQRCLQVTDVTSSSNTNIVYPAPLLDGNPEWYVRIK